MEDDMRYKNLLRLGMALVLGTVAAANLQAGSIFACLDACEDALGACINECPPRTTPGGPACIARCSAEYWNCGAACADE